MLKVAPATTHTHTHLHTHGGSLDTRLDGRVSPESSPGERRRGKGERDRGERYAEVACLAPAYHLLPLLHARHTLATGRERDERGSPGVEESERAGEPTLPVCSVNINCIFCSPTLLLSSSSSSPLLQWSFLFFIFLSGVKEGVISLH